MSEVARVTPTMDKAGRAVAVAALRSAGHAAEHATSHETRNPSMAFRKD